MEKWLELGSAGVVQDGDPAKGYPDFSEHSWMALDEELSFS